MMCHSSRFIRAAILTISTIAVSALAAAQGHERVLYSFQGRNRGQNPFQIISDGVATIYGVCEGGGTAMSGMVFEVSKTSGIRPIYNFRGAPDDGSIPIGLVLDDLGNLFGTTGEGGTYNEGTVFELAPTGNGQWTETVLYNFGASSTDGATPLAGLAIDGSGNLYGTTGFGGKYGFGTVFELSSSPGGWTETLLYSFANIPDGSLPEAPVLFDSAGNLYGTTELGGIYSYGTVFELTPTGNGDWTESVVYSFGAFENDGLMPTAGLALDSAGNLYGTTTDGGGGCPGLGCGTVFQISPTGGGWVETVIHSFRPQSGDGSFPQGPVTLDPVGNLYGTATEGGANRHGTLFKLIRQPASGWAERIYSFTGGSDGAQPGAGVLLDSSGNIYGSTVWGGSGYGVIFEVFAPATGEVTRR